MNTVLYHLDRVGDHLSSLLNQIQGETMKFRIGEPFSLMATMVCVWCGGNGMKMDDGLYGPCKVCHGDGTVETSK